MRVISIKLTALLLSLMIPAVSWALQTPLDSHLRFINIVANINTVPLFEKYELSIEIDGVNISNPFDPEEIDLSAQFTAPSGKTLKVWGYYDGVTWKVRFSPNEIGKWSSQLLLKTAYQNTRSKDIEFIATPSNHLGWLRVDKMRPRYLKHSTGERYFGIGQAGAKSDGMSIDSLSSSMEEMQRNGMNTLLVWWGEKFPLESEGYKTKNTGLGRYDMEQAGFIDEMVSKAEENNVILIPVLWSHNQFYNRYQSTWNAHGEKQRRNPYRKIDNESMPANQWSVHPLSLKYQKKLYRYVIARWSYSRAIGIWSLMSEIDATPLEHKRDWANNTSNWFHQHDPFGHPTTISVTANKDWGKGYDSVDVVDYHAYPNKNELTTPTHRINRLLALRKPLFIGELGIEDPSTRAFKFILESWAAAFSGFSIAPLYWWMANDRFSNPPGSMDWQYYLGLQNAFSLLSKNMALGTQHIRVLTPGDYLVTSHYKPPNDISRPKKPHTIDLTNDWAASLLGSSKEYYIPTTKQLPISQFLHGRNNKSAIREHTFTAIFSNNANLSIKISGFSKSGASLTVSVDGINIFTRDFRTKKNHHRNDYFTPSDDLIHLPIPSGQHTIRISNSGRDWISINNYHFSNTIYTDKATLQRDQNINELKTHNFITAVEQQGSIFAVILPPPFDTQREVSFNFIPRDLYTIEWRNTQDGELLRKSTLFLSKSSSLSVPANQMPLLLKIVPSKKPHLSSDAIN